MNLYNLSNKKQWIYTIISASVIAYILFLVIEYLLAIDDEEVVRLLNFGSFISTYIGIILFMILIGWLFFLFFSKLSNLNQLSKALRLTVYSSTFLFLFTILEKLLDEDNEFVLENLLVTSICLLIIYITEQLFNSNQLKRKQLQYESEKVSIELKHLKAQVNPHFLFNALNTLYSEALKSGAKNLVSTIEKLSEILRYQIGMNEKESISLATEIRFIHQYVSYQKARYCNQENIEINYFTEVYNKNVTLRPLLLIPFIENAFKHGISLEKPSAIEIKVTEKQHRLILETCNTNYPKVGKESTGVGLKQIKKLLEISYPQHQLTQQIKKGKFHTYLSIELN